MCPRFDQNINRSVYINVFFFDLPEIVALCLTDWQKTVLCCQCHLQDQPQHGIIDAPFVCTCSTWKYLDNTHPFFFRSFCKGGAHLLALSMPFFSTLFGVRYSFPKLDRLGGNEVLCATRVSILRFFGFGLQSSSLSVVHFPNKKLTVKAKPFSVDCYYDYYCFPCLGSVRLNQSWTNTYCIMSVKHGINSFSIWIFHFLYKELIQFSNYIN